MNDISLYFQPVNDSLVISEGRLGHSMLIHDENGFPELNGPGIAIIYVPEYRKSNFPEGENETFRQELYDCFKGDSWNGTIYDLGTIVPGEKVDDTYYAVANAVGELVKNDILPIVIGGSQDLTMACYRGFEKLEQTINICAIDNKLDIGEPDSDIHADGFVSHLLMQRPCYLFNYATVGVQRPFVSRSEVDLFDKLFFDICRLGAFNANFKVAEPHLRNSDVITMDFSSIKAAESDPSCFDNANGFYAEQVCQLAKYSGISDKVNCLGLFNIHPNQNKTASNLLAQIVWYFLDGVAQRVGDFPIGSKKNYVKFHVHMDDFSDDLVFYRSDKSNRWWLEVKYPAGQSGKYERHQLVPCDQSDYDGAMNNQIPNLWWKTIQKLS